jgi:hypothetical protein
MDILRISKSGILPMTLVAHMLHSHRLPRLGMPEAAVQQEDGVVVVVVQGGVPPALVAQVRALDHGDKVQVLQDGRCSIRTRDGRGFHWDMITRTFSPRSGIYLAAKISDGGGH